MKLLKKLEIKITVIINKLLVLHYIIIFIHVFYLLYKLNNTKIKVLFVGY